MSLEKTTGDARCATLEKAWSDTCRVILGTELGPVADYEKFLLKHLNPVYRNDSVMSGKPVALSRNNFSPSARFASMPETPALRDRLALKSKLSINQVKDFDSLRAALSEQLVYAGDIVLGNSQQVTACNNCQNLHYALGCSDVYDSKNMAYCTATRLAEGLFGSFSSSESQYSIRLLETGFMQRSFECYRTFDAYDAYYTGNVEHCRDVMFCFNLRNKTHAIGNLELPKDKYQEMKRRLVSEIADELKRKKDAPSVIDIINGGNREETDENTVATSFPGPGPIVSSPSLPTAFSITNNSKDMATETARKQALAEINRGFQSTTQVILGTRLDNVDDYAAWLKRDVDQPHAGKSALSGAPVLAPPMRLYEQVLGQMLTIEEGLEHGSEKISGEEAAGLRLSNASQILGDKRFCPPVTVLGANGAVLETALYGNASHIYKSSYAYKCKHAAYSYWPRNSEYAYGSQFVFESNMTLKCYNSERLARCFEVSDSLSCADSYYCHDCENLENAILCFHAKGLRYAVGNVEVGKERFIQIKHAMLEKIARELRETSEVKTSIYNISDSGV